MAVWSVVDQDETLNVMGRTVCELMMVTKDGEPVDDGFHALSDAIDSICQQAQPGDRVVLDLEF